MDFVFLFEYALVPERGSPLKYQARQLATANALPGLPDGVPRRPIGVPVFVHNPRAYGFIGSEPDQPPPPPQEPPPAPPPEPPPPG